MTTLYWHDYETWGANPSVDRPSQFAGVRTDEDLNIIGEPLVEYCRPPMDVLPHPEACLVTGITPQVALKEGLAEHQFIQKIHKEFSQPGTCGVGYNSLRFDDEVTRYTLYRNFYDPYEREWRNGNSRWDIIDMVRLVYALRPEGIEWPVIDDRPSFKLEFLTEANGISHASAHDAFSDVEATIALAKLIKTRQPKLYDYVYQHRSKHAVTKMIDVARKKPLLHISSMFSVEHGCAAIVVPLAAHPKNKNAVIAFDLSCDPAPLEKLSAEEIAGRVFSKTEDLPDGVERLPIKLIHLNKCPVLASVKLLDDKLAARLCIDKALCEKHWQKILPMELEYKLRSMYQLNTFPETTDPEQKLYDGFVGDADKHAMRDLREANEASLSDHSFVFDDARLNSMVLRYKARNFPAALSDAERNEWTEFVMQRLQSGGENIQSLSAFKQRIAELKQAREGEKAADILNALDEYANTVLDLAQAQ